MAFPCTSAGVFCYMIHNGQTFFILGRERLNHQWVGSGKWAEFGGQAKPEDQGDSCITAARECFEESLGIFGNVQTALQTEQFNFQVLTKRSGRHVHGGKATFVMEVPWEPDIVQRFFGRREHLQEIVRLLDVLTPLCDAVVTETQGPFPQLTTCVQHQNYKIIDLIQVEKCADNTFWLQVVAEPLHRLKFQFDPLALPFDPDKRLDDYTEIIIVDLLKITKDTNAEEMTSTELNPTVKLIFKPDSPSLPPEPTINLILSISKEQAALYIKILQLKNELKTLIGAFPKDVATQAINMDRWIPVVNKDFLEKDEIRLWTMAELQECIYGQDLQKPLRFSFLVSLKIILQQLSMTENGSWRKDS